MQIFKQIEAVRDWVDSRKRMGQTVGLVPTMGALHEGHYSLVRKSCHRCATTIATIFVNPTQFGPQEDLQRYPRTLEADQAGLAANGADAVFLPDAETIYPTGFSTYVQPPAVSLAWEGASRPEHFRGVCTVVLKLFQIIPATHAFFGQKDFQQLCTIRSMVRDFNLPIEVVSCPIVRDLDGLALSSRNRYLTPEQRARALAIPTALQVVADAIARGERSIADLEALMRLTLLKGPVDSIDYAVLADPVELKQLTRPTPSAVALIAVRVGDTRLIDNCLVDLCPN
jgi:pantoate--beta-alanine ligase